MSDASAGEPNGMKFFDERELIITDYRNGLMACDVATGAARPYLDRRSDHLRKQPRLTHRSSIGEHGTGGGGRL